MEATDFWIKISKYKMISTKFYVKKPVSQSPESIQKYSCEYMAANP